MSGRSASFIRWVLSISLFLAGGSARADNYWQLVFRYDAGSLNLVMADPVPEISKQITTPGLQSAALRVTYHCDWVDAAGQTLHSTEAQMPVGIRATIGDSEPCRWLVPEEGTIVVRITGPDPRLAAETVHLNRTAVVDKMALGSELPAPFVQEQWSFSLPQAIRTSAQMQGPVGGEKIRDTGPDGNRLVIVIMGDGYTAANLGEGAFESAAGTLGASIEAKAPWDVLFSATNLYRVDIESNEEGADHEVYGVLKDTYLNSSFWVNNIERLLALTGDGYSRAIAAANGLVGPGVWDIILVLVNSTKYGGSGGGIAVSSVHSAASEVIVHELGHSFAYLADEYETAYPGYPSGDWEPNVDYDYAGPGLKWLVWVEPGTPLPTPEMSPYLSVVGAFEGARYLSTGIYRPWYNCEMRSLNRPFCPVCQEAHVLEFTGMMSLVDELIPLPGTSQIIGPSAVSFSATPLPFDGLEYIWSLDGVPLAGEYAPSMILTADQMSAHHQTLQLDILYITPLVRQTTVSATYTWPVSTAVSLCCTGIVGDANFNGEYEPTISDVAIIIDHLFLSGRSLACYEEADANQSGGLVPEPSDITISDVSILVDHLFISGTPLPECF